MRTNSMKVVLYKYFTPRVVILRVTNRELEREIIYEVQSEGLVSLKKRTRREKEEEGKGTRALNLLFKLQAVCVCVRVFMTCAILRLRIANRLVMGSFCRGGIVHIRFGFSRARSVRPKGSKALWRFRVSTANSLSGRTWPQTDTPIRYIDHTYAQKDI